MMKRLLLLFSLLALVFAGSPAFAQFTQAQQVAEWQRAKTYTKAYLDAMPEDGYAFKPTPEIRSFAQQMLHLAYFNYLFGSVASGKLNPPMRRSTPPTKDSVTKAVMDSYDFMIGTLQNMTPEQLDKMALKKFDGVQVSNGNLIGKAFEHQSHHRGQTTIYLRLKGVKPPEEMLF